MNPKIPKLAVQNKIESLSIQSLGDLNLLSFNKLPSPSRKQSQPMPINPPLKIPTLPTPLPRCYWVVEELFLAGAYAGHADPRGHVERVTGLWNAGMRTFINLIEEDEANPQGVPFTRYDDLLRDLAAKERQLAAHLRFPIVDRHITSIDRMRSILDAIDLSISNKIPVYVHCFGGIGRTGTVVGCWLLRHGLATPDNVLDIIATLRQADEERSWREAPENQLQIDFVQKWPEAKSNHPKPSITQPSTSAESARHSMDRKRTGLLRINGNWFERLFGFTETDRAKVHRELFVDGNLLRARNSDAAWTCGELEIASLHDLRERALNAGSASKGRRLQISEIVGDARALHADPQNAGALFQVASQFNLLEMISPNVTPEEGITGYENDRTQGPVCAVACAAGTLYRNYFVPLSGPNGREQIGQTAACQVDALESIGEVLGNDHQRSWEMRNGYALPSLEGIQEVDSRLRRMSESELDAIRSRLKIGLQWETEVTLEGCGHLVSQAYCSAMPVGYSNLPTDLWERFARLILEASYEATFAAGVLNAVRTGNKTLFLTLIGGGVFSNKIEWILDAIRRAATIYSHYDLDVKIVSYGSSNPEVRRLCSDIKG